MRNIWSGKTMTLGDRLPFLFVTLLVFLFSFSMPWWACLIVSICSVFCFGLILFDDIFWDMRVLWR